MPALSAALCMLNSLIWHDSKDNPILLVWPRRDVALAKEYHEAENQELKKIDWSRQRAKTRKQYSKPLSVLKLEFALRRIVSNCKRHWIGH